MIGIYKITNPKGKIYIGQSRNIKYRFKQYKRLSCKAQPKLFNSFNKYGVKNHIFEVLEQCEIHELNNKERYYQMLFDVINPLKGLNLVLVANDVLPIVYSDELRNKISEYMKGNKNGLGSSHTLQEKINISNRMIGNKHGLGKTHTPHEKINISNRMKGNTNGIKIILNTSNGVFYYGAKEASESVNMNYNTLRDKLTGRIKLNNTPFIYV